MKNLIKQYIDLDIREQEEFAQVPKFFAFGEKQIDENYNKFKKDNPQYTFSTVYHVTGGLYTTQDNVDKMIEISERYAKQRLDLLNKHDDLLKAVLIKEMWNIEYGYYQDDERLSETILYKKFDDLTDRELKIYREAQKEYLDKFYDLV